MDKLIQRCKEVQKKLDKYSKEFLMKNPQDLNGYAMVFNNVRLIEEWLGFYRVSIMLGRANLTPTSGRPLTDEMIKKENRERINEVTKWCFTHSMSCFEHTAKMSIYYNLKKCENLINNLQGYRGVYLDNIMKESLELGKISTECYKDWHGLVYVRNKAVHNNAIADETETLTIGNVTVNCVKNEQIIADRFFFVNLIDNATDNYQKWINSII